MGKTATRRIRVYGVVQGVGFRPTVSRYAAETGVRGTVCNRGPYVEIFVQGSGEAMDRFQTLLLLRPPRRAAILKLDSREVPDAPVYEEFRIIESEKTAGEIYISPDIAICEDCERELKDPSDPRYLHPFINCTNCGPRLTILEALPYDRERTSMRMFPMCRRCETEYHDPASRRYDAQPVCCPDCGPEVYLIRGGERGREAILRARKILAEGGILAVKGIGGFHLCCDAGNEAAVQRLREHKHRPQKPFAVMARDLAAAERECVTDEEAEAILTGHQKPILLLERRAGGKICPSVAPGNPRLGIMLPYAPLHHLLFDYDDGRCMPDCLVMTSGNISGAPICRDDEAAVRELGTLCDEFLSHNRAIRIRADDSVMDRFEGKPYMIRRSRGYAPLPVLISGRFSGSVLAIGGELKNTFCLSDGERFYPSPYVGDLEDIRTVDALRETVGRFQKLLEREPEIVACDLHPAYHSSEVAEEFGLPVVRVQHHYAHILSCMAENDCEGPVIGVSFDGTGYGTDGTVWGGEILLCDRRTFTRAGHIVPFRQVGGDAAAREGWRIAVSMIFALNRNREETKEIARRLSLCTAEQADWIMTMAERGLQTVTSTSAGRLFDAVSAMLGFRMASTFEGEASMALQFAAEAYEQKCMAEGESPGDPAERVREALRDIPLFSLPECEARVFAERTADISGYRLATDELVREILSRRLRAGEESGWLAYAFHVMLAEQITAFCGVVRTASECGTAALSGGVFQNTLLLRLTVRRLREEGFEVLTHHMIPANDGGIALGQALYAAQVLADRKNAAESKE